MSQKRTLTAALVKGATSRKEVYCFLPVLLPVEKTDAQSTEFFFKGCGEMFLSPWPSPSYW